MPLVVVEWLAHARRRMVEYVFACQPVGDEGVGHKEVSGLIPDLWLVAPDPCDLGSHRLRGQGVAAALDDLLVSVTLGQLLHFEFGPGIDAVQDPGPQRMTVVPGGQKAGAD